jgi:hypothetical protein
MTSAIESRTDGTDSFLQGASRIQLACRAWLRPILNCHVKLQQGSGRRTHSS